MNSISHNAAKIVIVVSVLFYAFSVGARSVKDVKWLYAFNSHVDITRIDYGQQKTTVYFTTCKHHDESFCISHGMYVVGDDGKHHYVKGTKGISIDSVYQIGNGKGLTFSIDFEPIAISNQFLDVCNPSWFSIYGVHDGAISVTIPQARGEMPETEATISLFKKADVEIEGKLHDPTGEMGTIVQINYVPPRPEPDERSKKTAKIDADGNFCMRFNMYAPQRISFIYPYVHGNVGTVYVRPGDKIFVDIFDPQEGKGIKYTNLSGGNAYNNLSNAPAYPFDANKYYANLRPNMRFMLWSYQKQQEELMMEYGNCLSFANYICWHYQLSPYETKLYIDNVHGVFISLLLSTDIGVKLQHLASHSSLEKNRFEAIIKNMDYSYLKRLNPNDPTLVSNTVVGPAFELLGQLPPIEDCFNMITENEPNRWQKVIKLQQDELNRITGWTGRTFVMEQIIINDIWHLSKKEIEKEYIQVRQLLSHPYSQTYFDLYINEVMRDKS